MSTFQSIVNRPVSVWPWSACDPTAPILTQLRVWTTLPGSNTVVEAWSGEFSLYLGTGVRGLAVTVSNPASPATVTPGTTYTLSIQVANPNPPDFGVPNNVNRQALPSRVSVSLVRLGRMFSGAPVVATLVTSQAVQSDGVTATVNVVIPINTGTDWVANDVAFKVRD